MLGTKVLIYINFVHAKGWCNKYDLANLSQLVSAKNVRKIMSTINNPIHLLKFDMISS